MTDPATPPHSPASDVHVYPPMDHQKAQEQSQAVAAAAAYRRFRSMYANSKPIRGQHSFEAAVRAANWPFDDVSDEFLRSLDTDWVHGLNDTPFSSAESNRRYRRLVRRLR